jgi:D-alanyl-D-alanine carboxypeptidase
VLGGNSSDNRFSSTISLFDYGFANFRNKIILDKNIPLNDPFTVKGGKRTEVLAYPERNVEIFSKNDQTPNVTYNIVDLHVKAPVAKGDVIGKIEVYNNNILYDTVNVIAGENVLKRGFGDAIKSVGKNWAM